MSKIADLAHRLGIYDSLPNQLAMALGAGETTLLKMTTAYSMLDNGGKKIEPTLIDRVQDRYGKTVFKHDTPRLFRLPSRELAAIRPSRSCSTIARRS